MTGEEGRQMCECRHLRSVHGGADGLGRCVLRSCSCGVFLRRNVELCPVCVYGEPADHTCDSGQQHRYRVAGQ